MPLDKDRLTALEDAVKDHEDRITALEARLDPKTREQLSKAVLEDLLDELAGRTEERS